jgi:hypothetical protein
MRNVVFVGIGVFVLGMVLSACINDPETAGDAIAGELNNQIKSGNFEKVYSEMSEAARSLTPQDEFMTNMNQVVKLMKEYDDSLTWRKGSLLLSNEYRDLYFIHREMGPTGKRLNIEVTISLSKLWRFYDLCVTPAESSTGAVCVTNALRKV